MNKTFDKCYGRTCFKREKIKFFINKIEIILNIWNVDNQSKCTYAKKIEASLIQSYKVDNKQNCRRTQRRYTKLRWPQSVDFTTTSIIQIDDSIQFR